MLNRLLFLFFVCTFQTSIAQNKEPYWEYGMGIGGVQFEDYPGSDEYTQLILPVPTFQYHGEIIHANDRDGVQAQFFKSEKVILDFSGMGYPPLKSKDNDRRRGMRDIDLIGGFGPQLIYLFSKNVEFNFSTFQGVSLSASRQATTGPIYQSRFVLFFEDPIFNLGQEKTLTRLFFTSRWAERSFQKIFYDVKSFEVENDRTEYRARSGLMSHEISLLWQMDFGKPSTYVGISYADYSSAVNKASPLLVSDQAFTFFLGFNYVFSQSDN
ncbi:MAG: MipA/OmpV family protein [Bdellovibrionales bacterium]